MRQTLLLAAFTLALAPASVAQAQVPLIQQGPELERLAFLEGNWKGDLTRFLPGDRTLELTPELSFAWDVGGVWLRGQDSTRLPDGSVIQNSVWLTWHRGDEVYVGAWQDNVFPGFVTFQARWLDDKRLELDTGEFELAGRPHRVVYVYSIEGTDRFCTEMRQGWNKDSPRKVMAGCFQRATAAGSASQG